jgi:hypothetical protein
MDEHEAWQRQREAQWSMEARLRWLDEAWELAHAIAGGRRVQEAGVEPPTVARPNADHATPTT